MIELNIIIRVVSASLYMSRAYRVHDGKTYLYNIIAAIPSAESRTIIIYYRSHPECTSPYDIRKVSLRRRLERYTI